MNLMKKMFKAFASSPPDHLITSCTAVSRESAEPVLQGDARQNQAVGTRDNSAYLYAVELASLIIDDGKQTPIDPATQVNPYLELFSYSDEVMYSCDDDAPYSRSLFE